MSTQKLCQSLCKKCYWYKCLLEPGKTRAENNYYTSWTSNYFLDLVMCRIPLARLSFIFLEFRLLFRWLRQNVLNNPHILDWFFTQRTESFVKNWLQNSLGGTGTGTSMLSSEVLYTVMVLPN